MKATSVPSQHPLRKQIIERNCRSITVLYPSDSAVTNGRKKICHVWRIWLCCSRFLFGFTREIFVYLVNAITTQVNLRMTCLQINQELVKIIYLLFMFWLFSKYFLFGLNSIALLTNKVFRLDHMEASNYFGTTNRNWTICTSSCWSEFRDAFRQGASCGWAWNEEGVGGWIIVSQVA